MLPTISWNQLSQGYITPPVIVKVEHHEPKMPKLSQMPYCNYSNNDKSYIFLKNSIKNIIGMFIQFKEELLGEEYLLHILGIKLLKKVPMKDTQKAMNNKCFYGPYKEFVQEYVRLFLYRKQRGLKYNSQLVIDICGTKILKDVMIYFLDKIADYWLVYRSKIKEDNKFPYRNAIMILKEAIVNNQRPKFRKLSAYHQFKDPQVPQQLQGVFIKKIRKLQNNQNTFKPNQIRKKYRTKKQNVMNDSSMFHDQNQSSSQDNLVKIQANRQRELKQFNQANYCGIDFKVQFDNVCNQFHQKQVQDIEMIYFESEEQMLSSVMKLESHPNDPDIYGGFI